MSIEIHGLRKSFRTGGRKDRPVVALDGIDLDARHSEMVVVVGPSGSGKTTLLRCIAGLESADEGTIAVNEKDVTGAAPGERDVAMVFQEYALYPHLSARNNIAFGLRARRVPGAEIDQRVDRAVAMLGLTEALARRPAELSGGERQRVALARAIVREPALFLMDEPLSNLDAELRARTRTEIRELQRSLQVTTLYVTHDQIEAMTMGDRVAVLCAGKVEQIGAPMTLYDRPATEFVARFLGSPPMNVFPADLLGGAVDGATELGVRAERIRFAPVAEGRLVGRVTAVEAIGSEAIVHVDVQGHQLLARIGLEHTPSTEGDIGLLFLDAEVHRFDETGKAIG